MAGILSISLNFLRLLIPYQRISLMSIPHLAFMSGQRPPPERLDWSQLCGDGSDTLDSAVCSLIELTSRFIDLHSSVKTGASTDPDEIIERALKCETELGVWEQ
jgi:hypothetical protein